MPLRSVKMKRFILGFQRRVWCPKWTPLSRSWRMVTTAMMFFLLGVGPRVHRWWLDLAFLEVGRVLARAGRFSVSRPSVVMGPDACARSDLSVLLGTEGRARGRPVSRSEAPS